MRSGQETLNRGGGETGRRGGALRESFAYGEAPFAIAAAAYRH